MLDVQASGSIVEEVERLDQMVRGPPEPRWLTSTARAALLLQEAQNVVELTHGLPDSLGLAPTSLRGLTQSCRRPLETSVLPILYLALLRYCLLEVMQQEKPCKHFLPAQHWPVVMFGNCACVRVCLVAVHQGSDPLSSDITPLQST
jgi:hypothetical protein